MPFASTILVTGGSSGLGRAAVTQLSREQPDVQIVIAARSGDAVAKEINEANAQSAVDNSGFQPNVVYLPLDLSTAANVRAFAKAYTTRQFPPLSALILNAALQVVDKVHTSPDGGELMWTVNHTNHALLFYLLKLYLNPSARIIVVSSSSHDPKFGRNPPTNYTTAAAAANIAPSPRITLADGIRLYATSKLGNVLWTYALADRVASQGRRDWHVMLLDPGVMATGLYRNQSALFAWVASFFSSWLVKRFMLDSYTPQETAAVLVKMATDPCYGQEDKKGKYFEVSGGGTEVKSSDMSYDRSKWDDIWSWTIGRVATDKEEAEAFEIL